jgi:hypothetical protein
MPNSDVPKTYVRPDNTAVLTCPHCRLQKVVLADSFNKCKLRVKCLCQKVFTVILENRNRVRKKTRLPGTYINNSHEGSNGSLLITDISVTGLSFARSEFQKFKVGDELTIEFTLDDAYETKISKDVIIKNIRQDSIGCEFERSEDTFGSQLGHYIISDI